MGSAEDDDYSEGKGDWRFYFQVSVSIVGKVSRRILFLTKDFFCVLRLVGKLFSVPGRGAR